MKDLNTKIPTNVETKTNKEDQHVGFPMDDNNNDIIYMDTELYINSYHNRLAFLWDSLYELRSNHIY